jgi:hypothetical protein
MRSYMQERMEFHCSGARMHDLKNNTRTLQRFLPGEKQLSALPV